MGALDSDARAQAKTPQPSPPGRFFHKSPRGRLGTHSLDLLWAGAYVPLWGPAEKERPPRLLLTLVKDTCSQP